MQTWHSDTPPDPVPAPGVAGWARIVARGGAMVLLILCGLVLLLVLRVVERPIFGLRRPVTPYITQGVCRGALAILGLRVVRHGHRLAGRGAAVANHGSWLDIFVLNAADRVYFVSKAEVRDWPGIGWLARATGTVFIRRDPREAQAQRRLFEDRLRAGHRLMFFPEGTSTDGQRVLPFKSTLFAAFVTEDLAPVLDIQPVSLRYIAPDAAPPRFYAWWGDMDFGSHMLKLLAAPRQGRVVLTYHPPVAVARMPDRKALARATGQAVARGFAAADPAPGPDTGRLA
ncbi:1-acyl-sn-glycerol-3-phosphate acyltransferase [Mesobaculum littorinae]|uniref:1-acyl-sn-glycerol-3-phosphate acyltransferase n=1 Tax=Mesobaculum littorinae TaxID=2486419 RepID=A0A438ALV9_9RHOB|nr:lysophospholipid acyltransferase family protein [Mesobaculum littorinae]RVV99738.1 1-acyl-sn-glycerol-3-phosphate acyltransferase [Mesobaculum littorinae]